MFWLSKGFFVATGVEHVCSVIWSFSHLLDYHREAQTWWIEPIPELHEFEKKLRHSTLYTVGVGKSLDAPGIGQSPQELTKKGELASGQIIFVFFFFLFNHTRI